MNEDEMTPEQRRRADTMSLPMLRLVCACATIWSLDACAQRPSESVSQQSNPAMQGSDVRTTDSTAAALQFVQGFYDWYIQVADKSRGPAWWMAMNSPANYLTTDLASALRDDSAATRVDPPWRESFNSDPFLDSQDPCPKYEAS